MAGEHVGLFVAGQGQNNVAAGLKALLFQADQGGDQHHHIELHVRGPAAIDIAVFDHGGEGIAHPVGGLGLDHVHMARQKHGLLAAIAAIASGQGGGLTDLFDGDIGVGKAARDQRLFQIGGIGWDLALTLNRAIADRGLVHLQCRCRLFGIHLDGRGRLGRSRKRRHWDADEKGRQQGTCGQGLCDVCAGHGRILAIGRRAKPART